MTADITLRMHDINLSSDEVTIVININYTVSESCSPYAKPQNVRQTLLG